MKSFSSILLFSFLALATAPIASLYAAADATDNAGNYGTDYNGQNLGTGFGAFSLYNSSGSSSNGGTFIGDSSQNGGGNSGNINTSGKSFGLYCNSGTAQVTRAFTSGGANASTALASGQVFSLSLDNGYISTGSSVGVSLQNASGTSELTLQFVGGNGDYTYSAGTTNNADTGVGYTANGLSLKLAEGPNNSFILTVTPAGGTTATFTGTTNDAISQFQVFNNAAGSGSNYDFFFNSPSVSEVPEASTWLMSLSFLGLLGGARRLRSHRA